MQGRILYSRRRRYYYCYYRYIVYSRNDVPSGDVLRTTRRPSSTRPGALATLFRSHYNNNSNNNNNDNNVYTEGMGDP